jgi:hypothetical protein
LLAKLNNLKQGDNSIETYYHNLKFHIMHCGLEECEEATENIFLRGLNTEIHDMLLHETYNSLTCLVKLASKIEIQLVSSEETIAEASPTCENKIALMRCHLLFVLLRLTLVRIKRIWLHTQ